MDCDINKIYNNEADKRHLADCPSCAAEYDRLESAGRMIAQSRYYEPQAQFKAQVLARLGLVKKTDWLLIGEISAAVSAAAWTAAVIFAGLLYLPEITRIAANPGPHLAQVLLYAAKAASLAKLTLHTAAVALPPAAIAQVAASALIAAALLIMISTKHHKGEGKLCLH